MVDKEELVREFETIKKRYETLYKELVQKQVPGYLDLVGLTCRCGESCGTGTSKVDPRLGITVFQSVTDPRELR